MKPLDQKDPRVKVTHLSIWNTALIFLMLFALSSIQSFILTAYLPNVYFPINFWLGMAGFWAIISLLFSVGTRYAIDKYYAKPMRRLSAATRRVTHGDFSISLPPRHRPEQYDYTDVIHEDFSTMVSELASTEILKSDFIANVSHELKTPLAVIQNYAMSLRKEELTEQEKDEYTDAILEASRNLTTLVTNILRLNKLENQEIVSGQTTFDLCEQLCSCILGFEDLWERKHINMEVNLEEKVLLHADESMLEIVWNNLLSNAVKFTEDGGTISVRQISDASSVTVTVQDSGCGMDGGTLNHIFDKFYQGNTSHSGEGNGLGLALVLRVVELMNGTITASSVPGQGSVFKVILRKE